MTVALYGTSVSRGIAIGNAHILEHSELEIPQVTIPDYMVQAEISRFQFAMQVAAQQLKVIREHIPTNTAADISLFIDTHLLMLDDPMLKDATEKTIEEKHCNAEHALQIQCDSIIAVFMEMDDPYLRTRKDDVEHVVTRIQRVLLNQPSEHTNIIDNLKGQIIVTNDLSPADTILMQHHDVIAIISEKGGPTSHTAILARGLNIPALVGVKQSRQLINDGEQIIIDSLRNVIIASPDDKTLKYYRNLQKQLLRNKKALNDLKLKPAKTQNKIKIKLHANIEQPEDISKIKKISATGVGLFRTEFLFMNREGLPDENEQFQAYSRVVKSLKGMPVTIRTLDIGADKSLESNSTYDENSSALGLRAIRMCLRDPSIFKPQIRAILRASSFGPVRLMIPMITTLQELLQVKNLISECKQDLKKRRIKFNNKLPVGCMIETPAAALLASSLAEESDFFSIGTNDLIQYTLAIDRIDTDVSYLYEPLHPAVLNLIQMTITAAKKAEIPVSLCGEMAGDIQYTRLLLGMGLTEFSMHPSTLLEVKKIIRASDTAILTKTVKKILKSASAQQVSTYLDKINL